MSADTWGQLKQKKQGQNNWTGSCTREHHILVNETVDEDEMTTRKVYHAALGTQIGHNSTEE